VHRRRRSEIHPSPRLDRRRLIMMSHRANTLLGVTQAVSPSNQDLVAVGPVRRPGRRPLVFDGDDTLWVTEPLYDAARIAAGKRVAAVVLDSAAWDALQRKIDVKNVSRFGLSVSVFRPRVSKLTSPFVVQRNYPSTDVSRRGKGGGIDGLQYSRAPGAECCEHSRGA